MSRPPRPDDGLDYESPLALAARAVLGALARRHDHRVVGMDNIPEGRCLLVVNHSLATYDVFLLMLAVWQARGRLPRGLGDRRLFQLPWSARAATFFGSVEASHEGADLLLDSDLLVLVAPGGMYEAIRSSEERYQLRWAERKGFVRLAIRTQTPIVLAACPRADDLFTVYRSSFTDRLYEALHLPIPLFKGQGWSLLPEAVKLTHHLGTPIAPPPVPDDLEGPELEALVESFHAEVTARMEALMATALEDEST